jgi:flagellar hook-basal body complex protein FliE
MVISVSDAIAAYKQSDGSLAETIKKKGDSGGADSFGSMLSNFAGDTLNTIKQGEAAAVAGVAGKANIQDVILAVNQASVALETVSTLRDKVITAYKEIMQMPV